MAICLEVRGLCITVRPTRLHRAAHGRRLIVNLRLMAGTVRPAEARDLTRMARP
ncbi:hypothetical protein Tgr7_0012 [Thioalkalivibrio sulfidiphilus HL-EbGr7]|uniref:Uncharacterized protein n=1 Tax=Thioalkalivibrio sulfidiphilus (strain HL-EbGR7) TaxID=396588 RepID=B8GST2_THISH|nr:hypothetical protein Tgr7_0012 [Thioalkalivibrio sulfidiphilus HL-EbGr7]